MKTNTNLRLRGERMKITISGNEFKVLKVYKKEHPLQDLFICKKKSGGYIECFSRFQIERQEPAKDENGRQAWTDVEDEYIKKQLESGKSIDEVTRNFNITYRSAASVAKRISKIQRGTLVTV